ncbi:HNH endonuclease [Candidatus Parcubacteria bacterium]|nr:HNH endonuclease [Patescibacteria group bacterium]MBU4477331.1 HNH endonuclease [Patescibacteria group bacterium]MCG2699380.1 HNH endonuclease [Candidatus Parcubacteria bacterium]
MIFEHSSKNKKVLLLLSAVILIAVVFLSLYSSVIFQEGNPWSQIKGITQLTFGKSDIVKLSNFDNKYLTKSKGGKTMLNNCEMLCKTHNRAKGNR